MSTAAAIRSLHAQCQSLLAQLPTPSLPDGMTPGEARVLAAIAAREGQTAGDLGKSLGLDAGYLSRLITLFQQRKLITRSAARHDKRAKTLALSPRGRALAALIIMGDMEQDEALVKRLPAAQQQVLAQAEKLVTAALNPAETPVVFRQLQLGDAGWIVHRHGALIAHDMGWDVRFEALAAQILADFIRNYDAASERSWVIERGGNILGSLLLVRDDAETARLRLLYVEPITRGMGLATKMLEKSIAFACSKGYRRVVLFTTSNLTTARAIYQRLGFTKTHEAAHDLFGEGLIGETWELTL